MYDIITIGAAAQDVFLRSRGFHLMHSQKLQHTCECFPVGEKINVEEIDFKTGGGATNAAATFKNLGFRVGVVCRVGNDAAGTSVMDDLRARGIPMTFVRRTKAGATGYAAILLTPQGDRTALVHRGVSASFTAADIPWDRLHARWLFITSLAGNIKLLKRIFSFAHRRGIQVAFNPGMQELQQGLGAIRELCAAAHVVLLNSSEATLLAGGAGNLRRVRSILQKHCPYAVVVTDGVHGAYYGDREQSLHARTRRIAVVNTTGAGDAFGAGFISGILRWHNPQKALQVATLNAEGVIQQMGAKTGVLAGWPSSNALNQVKIRKTTFVE